MQKPKSLQRAKQASKGKRVGKQIVEVRGGRGGLILPAISACIRIRTAPAPARPRRIVLLGQKTPNLNNSPSQPSNSALWPLGVVQGALRFACQTRLARQGPIFSGEGEGGALACADAEQVRSECVPASAECDGRPLYYV